MTSPAIPSALLVLLASSAAAATALGSSPALDPAASAPVAEAAAMAKDPKRTKQRSGMAKVEAFDWQEWVNDKKRYCDQPVPARIWQVAQAGPGVPAIWSLSPGISSIAARGSVALRVKVPAGAPVTFYANDLGAFQNKMTCITVEAGADGVASATWTATPGTTADCTILAACPVTSGQATFVVNVAP